LVRDLRLDSSEFVNGALVWKLRAALDERRIVQCGQVESPWAVSGSVLVSRGSAYFSAGIHPLADGIRVFCVDPATALRRHLRQIRL